jgi:hypothetical protein
MVRCYRLSLPLDEVKDCVKAARNGDVYEPKTTSGASPASDAASEHKATSDSSAGKSPKTDRVIERDLEDLTLTQQDAKKGAAPVLDAPVVGPSFHALLGRLNTWQAVLLWLLIVVAFLAIVPRIARLRRRARSGMRTE